MSELDPKAREEADKQFHLAHPEFAGRSIREDDPEWIKEHWHHFYEIALNEVLDETEADQTEAPCPIEKENKSWDLFLHCEHKHDGVTRSAIRPDVYELVPRGPQTPDPHKFEAELPFGSISNEAFEDETDEVEVYYRDDHIDPPPEITLLPQEPATFSGIVAPKVRTESSGHAVYKAKLRFDRAVMGSTLSFLTTVNVAKYKTSYIIMGIQRPTPRVDVYCPDEWEFKLSLPPFKAIKQGAKITGAKETTGKVALPPAKGDDTTAVATSSISGWQDNYNKSAANFYYNRDKIIGAQKQGSGTLTAQSALKGISLKRNGVQIKPAEMVYTIISLLKTGQQVLDVIKMIQDMVPKVGYYLEAELQLFQGEFKLGWGRKEYRAWQTYSWIHGGIDFTLLNYTFEAGAGAEAYGVVAQIYINTNVKLALALKGGVTGPESGNIEVPLTRTETFSAGARFEAGKYFELGASITSGFSGQIAIEFSWNDNDTGWKLTGTLKWLGLTADFKAGAHAGGFRAKWSKSYKVIDEMSLFTIEFPKEEKYQPPVMTDDEVKNRIIEEFEDMDLEIKEGTSLKILAHRMVASMAGKPIKRTPKNIEALVKEVHSVLLEKYATHNGLLYSIFGGEYELTTDNFDAYMDKDYLPMLNSPNYQDQLAEFQDY